MIVCAQCGERNADGAEFCGSCGTYLEWEPKPAAQPVPGAAQGPPGWPGQAAQGQPPPAQQPHAQQPHAQQPHAQQLHAQQPQAQQPRPQQPGAMRPTDERQAPPGHRPRLTERRVPQPGDLICGQCGEANPPTRKFCARCGTGLVEARVVPEKWWRRFLPRREPAKAGTRRRRRGGPGKVVGRVVRWALAVLLLAGVGLYGLVGPFRQAVNNQATSAARDVEDWFSKDPRPVRPTGITATAESPGHEAALAADNARNTYWAAPVEPELPTLVLEFDGQVELERAIFQVGIGDRFQTAHRPEKVHLVYSTGRTYDLTLADDPDPQTVEIENSAGAESVEVFVKSLHRSLQGNEVAISEIEFFTVE